ncbi:MAG TPA: hypothetical protein PK156_47460, partial [Polyangium sp.]|nr:hypothetical protein [Polyangium sp.]
SAPLHVTLRLARQQIDSAPTSPLLRLLLDTIRAFGDKSDVERVTRVFDAKGDYYTTVEAFQCLHKLNASYAIVKMREEMAGEGILGKFHIMKILHEVGAEIDTEWLLGLMLGDIHYDAELSNEDDDAKKRRRHGIYFDAEKILESCSFNATMKARIFRAYSDADDLVRSALWTFAGNNDMAEFDSYAHEVIQSQNSVEMGCVCGFLSRRCLPEAKKQQFVEELVGWVQRPQILNWDWRGFAVVKFLIRNGRTEPAMTICYGWLRTIIEAHRNLRLGQPIEHYCHRNIDIRAKLQQYNPDASTEFLRVWIMALVSTLEPVAASIPHEGLDELFHIRLSYAPNEETRHLTSIFNQLDCEYVNEKIRVESNSGQRIALLMVLGPLLQFDTVVQVLQEEVACWIDYSVPLETVRKVIESRWDERLARVMIEIVGQFEGWDAETDAQYFDHKLSPWIAEHLQRDWVERFITPYWEREIHRTSHRILTFWYETVMHQRNG